MDRFTRGFTAGVAGGVVMQIESLISFHLLQLTTLRFLDWAGILVFGDLPGNLLEIIIAAVVHLVFTGFLGIVLAFLISATSSRFYLLKAIIFGLVAGFFIYAIPVLLQTPLLVQSTTGTVISNYAGGIIWGLVAAYILRRLDQIPERAE